MTKHDIIKFLERKMEEKRNAVTADYKAAYERERQRIYEELGLPALAGQMQSLIQQAYDLWDDWKEKHKDDEGIKLTPYYYSLITHLASAVATEDATYKKLIKEQIQLDSKVLDNMDKERTLEIERVMATFTTVLATVRQMKYAKESAAYLKELGFDLSELENPVDKAQTALMVPVDTSYLFVKAA